MDDKPKRKAGRPKGSSNPVNFYFRNKNKQLFLAALEKQHGILKEALKVGGISRTCFHTYYTQDEEFRLMVDEIREGAKDMVENVFYDMITSGNTQAVLFYMKSRMRDRGYVETSEQTQNLNIQTVKMNYIIPENPDNINIQSINIKNDDENINDL